MKLPRFVMEDWLGGYRRAVAFNLAESGMADGTLRALAHACGRSIDELGDVLMEDAPTRGGDALRVAVAAGYAPGGGPLGVPGPPSPVTPDDVWVATGTGEALFALFNVLLEPGDRVVAGVPAFGGLIDVPRAVGAQVITVPYNTTAAAAGGAPRIDLDAHIDAIVPGTRLVIVNTPHNPTGCVWSRDALVAVAEACARVGAHLLVDEHYRQLGVRGGPAVLDSAIVALRGFDDVIVSGSLTKCAGAMGLRVGWLVGPRDVLDRCRDYRDYLSHTLSPLSERISEWLLVNGAPRFAAMRALRDTNAALLAATAGPGAGAPFVGYAPEGGCTAWCAVPSAPAPDDTDRFARTLIERSGVFVLPGSSFGVGGFVRVNVGSPRFAEALARLRGA